VVGQLLLPARQEIGVETISMRFACSFRWLLGISSFFGWLHTAQSLGVAGESFVFHHSLFLPKYYS
jgi:hypothetical protein